jgi:GT2 family glycosyltransferase
MQREKIGIGIVTCNRPGLFEKCISGIPEADVTVVVNDGKPYDGSFYPERLTKVIQHKKNLGVGRSKNDALRFLAERGCTHLFLCEDDIRILQPDICDKYIQASEVSGIRHFNFAYHGPRNKSAGGKPEARKVMEYEAGVRIGLNKNLTGAFSYYTKEVLDRCGYMDPLYRNMWEHVDHTIRIIKKGFHPPFWWFADLADSYRYFEDLDPDLSRTTIKTDRWHSFATTRLKNFYFLLKNGNYPWDIPDRGEEEVMEALVRIKKDQSKK